ncbi:MAG TPA: cytochrome c maturation protein CcmE [Thermoanaerobaculia bacterium]|jgi:cytochrome c-type biogenesis protein CcmE|nr:cytochrome c maturation protein CcmE [Thermoanaerobaculia bacterium]
MKSKGYYVVGSILLLGFLGFSLLSFKKTLTPYVSYDEARSANRMVQVAGALEKGSSSYHQDNQSLYFNLKDPKTQQGLRVRYKGVKPGNFEDAISIVAIGRFDTATKEFEANKLLVKCPSKYQGAEVNKQYS